MTDLFQEWLRYQAAVAAQVEANIEVWRAMRDAWHETVFEAIVP